MMTMNLKLHSGVLMVVLCLAIFMVPRTVFGYSVLKRQIAPENNAEHLAIANNPMQIDYDEYPLVVPKRAAILLDRLMVALHHALEDEKNGSRKISDVYGRRNQGQEKPKTSLRSRNEMNPTFVPNFTNALTSDHLDIYSELPEDLDIRDLQQPENRQYDGTVSMKRNTNDADKEQKRMLVSIKDVFTGDAISMQSRVFKTRKGQTTSISIQRAKLEIQS